MSVDTTANNDRSIFFVTFTTTGADWPVDWPIILSKFHAKKCDMVLLVPEGGDTHIQHLHYHSVGTWPTKHGGNVSKLAERLYNKHGLPWTKHAVKVIKVKHLVGMFHYLLKAKGDEPPLMLMGWQMSWIKQQCVDNVKSTPYKMLLKDKMCLTAKSATPFVLKYAEAKNLPLSCKQTFADVISEMMCDGYQFEAVRLKWLFTQVMALSGHQGYCRNFVLGELNFIDEF